MATGSSSVTSILPPAVSPPGASQSASIPAAAPIANAASAFSSSSLQSLDVTPVTPVAAAVQTPSRLLAYTSYIQAGPRASLSLGDSSRNTPSPLSAQLGSPPIPSPAVSLAATPALPASDGKEDIDVEALLKGSPPEPQSLTDTFGDLTETSRDLGAQDKSYKMTPRPGPLSLARGLSSVVGGKPLSPTFVAGPLKSSLTAVSSSPAPLLKRGPQDQDRVQAFALGKGQPRKGSSASSPSGSPAVSPTSPHRPMLNRKGSVETGSAVPNPLQGEFEAVQSQITTLTALNSAFRALVTKACDLAGVNESSVRPRPNLLQSPLDAAKHQMAMLHVQIKESQVILRKVCADSGITEETVRAVVPQTIKSFLASAQDAPAIAAAPAEGPAVVSVEVSAAAPDEAGGRERKGSSAQEAALAKLPMSSAAASASAPKVASRAERAQLTAGEPSRVIARLQADFAKEREAWEKQKIANEKMIAALNAALNGKKT